MRKVKTLLSLFLCAACIIPSIHAGAVTINRPGIEADDEKEEGSHLTTDIEEVTTPGSSEIITENIVEPADIIFVIDSTGSMGSYIQNVADNVEEFSKKLETETLAHLEGKEVKVKTRMAVVEYKDTTCDGNDSTIVHTVDGSPWHKSTAELIKTLQIVKSNVDGGGDIPETVLDALGYVVDGETFDFGKEENKHKFVVVLSDAGFKEQNRFGYTASSMAAKLDEEKINLSVITEPGNYGDYKSIMPTKENTEENLFNINSKTFSENLNKLAKVIFKTIKEEIIHPGTSTFKVTCKGDNTIKVGNSAELKAVFHPEIPADANVLWSVEDEDVVNIKVSSDTLTCTVTGISEGTTKVEAKTEDGAFTGSYEIIVINDDNGGIAIEISKPDIKVTPAKKTIAKKKSFHIKVALTEEFKEDKEEEEIDDIWESNVDSVTFRSTKSSVASVNAKGKVTGKKKGKTIIKTTVTLADGKEFIYKTTVYVK